MTLRPYRAPIACAVLFAAATLCTHPFAAIGINDDWSYIWVAHRLAVTGHLQYNGWCESILGWQAYLGAAVERLFGFSFTGMRMAMLGVAALNLALLHRIFTLLGLTQQNASLATLVLAFSPVYLLAGFSFMSDVPGQAALLFCVWACLHALKARAPAHAVAWLAVAAGGNLLLGTARQIAWLGALIMVPCAVWLLRRTRGLPPPGALLWLLSCGFVAGCVRWSAHQPHFSRSPIIAHQLNLLGIAILCKDILTNSMMLALFLLPVLAAFVYGYPWRQARARRLGLLALAASALVVGAMLCASPLHSWLLPLSFPYRSCDALTARGMLDIPGILGVRPLVLSVPVRATITLATYTATLITLLSLWRLRASEPSARWALSNRSLSVLLLPATTAYLVLVFLRPRLFDRYLLPVFGVVLIFLLRAYQQRMPGWPPRLAWATLAFGAVFSLCCMHDLFALERARVLAAAEVIQAGVPRTALHAGYEYDGWTQLEASGVIDDPILHTKPGADEPVSPPDGPCAFWFSRDEPAIHAQYGLALQPAPCARPSRFAPVPIHTWLPPYNQQVLVLRLPG